MQLAAQAYPPIILKNLNPAWQSIAYEGVKKIFPSRRIIPIAAENNDESGIYLIKRGWVRLSNLFEDGQERVLLYIGQGTLFNENPVLTGGKFCLFTAMERTETIFFKKEHLNYYFLQHPELMMDLITSLSMKIQHFYSLLCDLRTFDSFQNICRTLLKMGIHNLSPTHSIIPKLSKQEFSALLGIHRSSLHKGLSRLEREGIISTYSRHKLEIYFPDQLRAYAEGRQR